MSKNQTSLVGVPDTLPDIAATRREVPGMDTRTSSPHRYR